MANKYLNLSGLEVLWGIIDSGFQRLKYGLESSYSDSYIPNEGQVCLVITENSGIQIKIGDGETKWSSLDYYNQGTDIIVRGYKGETHFFYDNILTKQITPMPHKLYIDLNTDKVYAYEHSQYVMINASPVADSSTAGIMKLYSSTGSNTDGTMSQKAITDALSTKVGARVENGVAIFS